MCSKFVSLCLICLVSMGLGRGIRDQLKGLVYETDEWSTPKSAWKLNVHGSNHWCLWTEEPDVWNKRSGGKSLKTPAVRKDRATTEEGAPMLHTRITGIPQGTYEVYMNNTNRLLGISQDGGKTWRPSQIGGENFLGYHTIKDGVFEVWVDDRYASITTVGPAYYDYIRFVPAAPPRIYETMAFTLPNGATQVSWITNVPLKDGCVQVRQPGEKGWKDYGGFDKPLRNHAVELNGLKPGATYEARVTTTLSPGVTIEGDPFRFVAGAVLSPASSLTSDIPLWIYEPSAKNRQDWAVSNGVPMKQGVLKGTEDVALFDSADQRVPCLFEVMSRWPDGSVKWLILHFKAATNAGRGTRYTLKTGTGLGKGNPALAEASELLEQILDYFDSDIVLKDGTVLAMEKSKVRQCLLAAKDFGAGGEFSGDYVDKSGKPRLRWRLELGALLGKRTDVRIRFTVGNNDFSADGVFVRSLALTQANPHVGLAPKGAATAWRLSDGTALPAGGGLFQYLEQESQLRVPGKASVKRGRGDGYLVSSDGRCQVQLNDFWQLYPKGIEVAEDGSLCWWLLPELPQEGYPPPSARNLREECIHWYWLKDGCYKFRQGMELSTEFTLRLDRSETPAWDPAWLKHRLFAQPSTAYACGTGAFGAVLPRIKDYFAEYEACFDRSLVQLEEGRRRRGEYGWMNFGDWFGERRWNWGNNEYDLPYVTAVQFARTGRLDVLRRGAEMARHYSTIDIMHYLVPGRIPRELIYEHCIGHLGLFLDPKDPRIAKERGFLGFCQPMHDTGHAHTAGMFYYACLLGDWHLLRVAERSSWFQAENYTRNFHFGIERAAGWPIINATYAYMFTGNPYYLNAAKIYFEKVKEVQNPKTGCFDLRQDQSECDCPDKAQHRGGKSFATGVLMHGLARLWELTGDDDVKTSIIRCADWLLDYAWNEAKQGFRYKTGCPKYANSGWYSVLVTEGIAYAGELSRNKRYMEFLKRTVGPHLKRATGDGVGSGKNFTQFHRHVPHLLYYMAKHGITKIYDLRNPLVGTQVVLVGKDGTGDFKPVVRNNNGESLACQLTLSCADGTVILRNAQVKASIAANAAQALPSIAMALKGKQGKVSYVLEWGGQTYRGSFTVLKKTDKPSIGKRVGFLGDRHHFTLLALNQCGLKAEGIADLNEASLNGFGAVIIGGDAFAYGKEAPPVLNQLGLQKLEDFAQAGGLVVCFQLNDTDWRLGRLGDELVAVEDNAVAGKTVDARHWVLDGVKDLSGVVCYDSILHAGRGWRVLVRDSLGGPCILSWRKGKGEILIIQPSVDRVFGQSGTMPHAQECRRVLQNVVKACAR